jgi:uncharacterized protein YegP (UPF0339 family)
MAGSGELYLRTDGTWGFRIKASSGEIVADDGGRGYQSREAARATLERVMHGEFAGPIEVVGAA